MFQSYRILNIIHKSAIIMIKSTNLLSSKIKILFLSSLFLVNSNFMAQDGGINQNLELTKSNTTTVGNIIVKKWADDKKSALSFSFDDAYLSHYDNVRPILDQFGFKGTFFLLAGSIHDVNPEWRYGLWWQFAQMATDGHEMAAHTMEHPHLKTLPVGDENTPNTITYELYQSKILIEQKIGVPVISLAYPYTEHNTTVDNVTKKYFQNARAIGNNPNDSSLTGMQWYSLTSKQPEFNLPRNSLADDLDELEDYKTFTQNSISSGKWTIFQGHEVLPISEIPNAVNQGLYLPISKEWLTDLAQWISDKSDNNDIWVETIGNVNRYMEERDHFNFNILSNTANQITIDVGDGLADNIYNYPLTVDIVIPNNWNEAIFTQGNVNKTLTPFTVDGINYVRTNLDPSGSNITIENSATIFTIISSSGSNGSITPLGSTLVNQGNNQIYTITPNAGFKIESILVDGNQEAVTNSEGQTYTFTNVTANHTISVTFKVKQFTITASTTANGTITPSGSVLVNYGSDKSFTITPSTGYIIDKILVDGNSITINSPTGQIYDFSNLNSNHTISASFKLKQYTISASVSSNGSISPSGSIKVDHGTDKTFTITPSVGYVIASIMVDGNSEAVTTPTEQTYTFTNVTANHSISATFSQEIIYYTFSGKILYENTANSPLQNVTVKLTSANNTLEVPSNSSGEYLFSNLLPGTYQISFITTNVWGGVNATDALKTARVFASLDTFSDIQKKAGDVNNDGSINSTDALLIARRFTGQITTFEIPEWVYNSPANITITNQNITLDIKSLASGDVDGSYSP